MNSTRIVTGVLAAAALSAPAAAQITLTDPVLVFQATNAQGTGQVTIPFNALNFDVNGNYTWHLTGGSLDIMDGPNVLGTITSATVGFKNYNPAFPAPFNDVKSVDLGFTVFAGASDTTFTVTSGLSSFANLWPGELRATGGMTLTDSAGTPAGATVWGNQPGGAYYSTFYNGGAPASGTSFADLIGQPGGFFSVGTNASDSRTDESAPAPNFTLIGGPIGSISAQWAFTLTQGDQAGTTSALWAIPAPASVSLVGAGLLGMRRRR